MHKSSEIGTDYNTNILLASASVFAFAGAAAAEVTFSGDATLGYNDDAAIGNDGFYWDGNVAVTLSQELDNGLTAGATFDFDFAEDNLGQTLDAGGYTLFIESDTAGLFFGDTAFAAETRWVGAGDMEQDAFSEADGETVLRGDITYGNIEASISYLIADADEETVTSATGGSDSVDQLSLGVSADFDGVNVVMGYQQESIAPGWATGNGDFNDNEIFGLSVGTTLAGADLRLAYASDQTASEESLGLSVSYPVGPVTASAYYVSESAGDDNYGLSVAYEDGPVSVTASYANEQGTNVSGIEGSYDVGNGLVVMAGFLKDDGTDARSYIAGEYDLGSGAALLVSYANDDDDVDGDEIGDPEFQRGTTVEVSFEF